MTDKGWQNSLASQLMRERVEARAVELGVNPAVASSALNENFAYLAHWPQLSQEYIFNYLLFNMFSGENIV